MDKALELVLVLVIVGVALAFGGVQPITYSATEAVVFFLVLLLLLKQTRQGRINLPSPAWPLLFILVVVLQLVPLPTRYITILSPTRLAAPDGVSMAQANRAWTTFSFYPHDTVLALIKFLAYLSAFLLAASFFDSEKRKSTLIKAVIFLGCFEAAYGIIQYLTGWQTIFGYTKQFGLEEATGTYINRNHFAGLLELILPFVVASVFYSFQVRSERLRAGANRRSPAGRSSATFQAIFYLFLLVIMGVALIFSVSAR